MRSSAASLHLPIPEADMLAGMVKDLVAHHVADIPRADADRFRRRVDGAAGDRRSRRQPRFKGGLADDLQAADEGSTERLIFQKPLVS